ncbi:MAG: M81 family metallopeptidase [Anaerolineae bacterium]|nr:M81 family metallopeptidase [Anaerolineae bacterium]
MPKILIAEGKQEVSSFNPVPSHYHDFDVSWGDEILAFHRGGHKELGGALSVFDSRADVELVPTYSFRAITSGGTLAATDFERIAAEFLASLNAAPPVDAVYFSLHGAMSATNEADPEGYLLAETRKILGEAIPIVISLDLHGVLTDRMLRHIDALTVFHTYPHVDFFETGVRAARLLLKILDEGVKPVMAKVNIPALVRGDELITETGLFGRSIRAAQAVEQGPGGLAAGMFIGNPFTDVPELRSNSLVITDNDPALAQQAALKLATDFWQVREKLQAPLKSIDEAIQIAFETEGPVIFSDAADATSSGASGDSNAIMRGLLAAGYPGRVLLPLVDPPAVEKALAAGIGATIHTGLGGALDSGRFTPVTVAAKVRLLSDGCFINESHGTLWNGGPTAVLETETMTIVTTSRPVSLYDRSLFLAHGQNPQHFDLIVVKSPHCQPQFFEAWAARLVNVDAPGSTSANLPSLGHTHCQRPIFPLDEGVVFEPKVDLFQRRR